MNSKSYGGRAIGGVSEEEFTVEAAQCYVLLETYKFKTNVISINLQKQIYQEYYNSLYARLTERYTYVYEQLQASLKNLHKNFIIAQGNSLRTANNIIRNYRRRVGLASNQPLSSFKYIRYEEDEKMLLQSMIYNQRQNYESIKQFKAQLGRAIELGNREIEEKYRRNQKIKENYQNIMDVIDKTECYTHKYYDNFERSMLTTIPAMQSYFEKLNGYLSVWQNIASTKAYEVKSFRELQIEQKSRLNQKPTRFFEQQSEQRLQELIGGCAMHSSQRQQYRRRLNDLRRYNSERLKKLQTIGKMLNRRRNRTGILLNKSREVGVLEWVVDLDNVKIPWKYLDQFKGYNGENDQNQFRLTNYQIQKPFKKAEEIKAHSNKFGRYSSLSFEWWYDRFGKNGIFDLISSCCNQVQKRVEFETIRQTELQNTDDRKKRDLLEKQIVIVKQNERRQCLHIGYRHVHDKTQLQWLNARSYATEYIPQIYSAQQVSNVSFSDDEESESEKDFAEVKKVTRERKEGQNLERKAIMEELPFLKIKNQIVQNKDDIVAVEQNKEEIYSSLQQQIIHSFFRQYSLKLLRKDDEAQSKKTIFLYFNSVAEIVWDQIAQYFQNQKIFILTKRSVVYCHKIISVKQERIKCVVFSLEEQIEEDTIKAAVSQKLAKIACVTVKFQPIYTQLQPENTSAFMIGLLSVLNRRGEMPEEYENKDYIAEGRQIIQDFNLYFYPSQNHLSKNLYMKRVKPSKSKQIFKPNRKQEEKIQTQVAISTSAQASVASNHKNISSGFSTQFVRQANAAFKKEQSSLVDKLSQNSQMRLVGLEMKKSNSREFLQTSNIQIELGKLKVDPQYQNADQNDYESL